MARPDGVFRSVVVVSDTGNGLVQIFTEESEPAGDASIPMPLGMHPAGYYAVVVASGRSDVFYTVDSP